MTKRQHDTKLAKHLRARGLIGPFAEAHLVGAAAYPFRPEHHHQHHALAERQFRRLTGETGSEDKP